MYDARASFLWQSQNHDSRATEMTLSGDLSECRSRVGRVEGAGDGNKRFLLLCMYIFPAIPASTNIPTPISQFFSRSFYSYIMGRRELLTLSPVGRCMNDFHGLGSRYGMVDSKRK